MIYIKNPNTNSLFDLINDGFSVLSWDNTGKRFVATYSDEECSYEECHEARRSFYDLLEIARTYFPNTTEKELAEAISKLENITCFICCDIEKYVFFIDRNSNNNYNCFSNNLDRDVPTVDGFSFNDFLNLLN